MSVAAKYCMLGDKQAYTYKTVHCTALLHTELSKQHYNKCLDFYFYLLKQTVVSENVVGGSVKCQ